MQPTADTWMEKDVKKPQKMISISPLFASQNTQQYSMSCLVFDAQNSVCVCMCVWEIEREREDSKYCMVILGCMQRSSRTSLSLYEEDPGWAKPKINQVMLKNYPMEKNIFLINTVTFFTF